MHTHELNYSLGDTTFKGFLASPVPEAQNPVPAVLVVHEWWGQTEYVRRRAEMLAGLGYCALAVDLYGDGRTAEFPAQAQQLSNQVLSAGEVRPRFEAAMAALKALPAVDGGRMAAIGYCFGGGVVLSMARAGLPLKGVVSFHGVLKNLLPASPGASAKCLVLNGADDPFVSAEDRALFKEEMDAAGIDYRMKEYPGVKHAFTNPKASQNGERFDLPLAYDAKADADSWDSMMLFLQEVLGV